MKSKVFCDIRGTFTKGENREKALFTFVENLNDLAQEEIDFSFISSDNYEFVLQAWKEMNKYSTNDDKIKFGKQYANDIAFDTNGNVKKVPNNKIEQISLDLKENKYDNIYYFDDSAINIKIFKSVIPKLFPNSHVLGIHVKNSIDGLNEKLSNYISQNKMKI